MNDGKLTIDLSGVGNDIPTKLGKSRPTLTLRTLTGKSLKRSFRNLQEKRKEQELSLLQELNANPRNNVQRRCYGQLRWY